MTNTYPLRLVVDLAVDPNTSPESATWKALQRLMQLWLSLDGCQVVTVSYHQEQPLPF